LVDWDSMALATQLRKTNTTRIQFTIFIETVITFGNGDKFENV